MYFRLSLFLPFFVPLPPFVEVFLDRLLICETYREVTSKPCLVKASATSVGEAFVCFAR